jgi:hypothetical protein
MTRNQRVSSVDIRRATNADPTPFLESRGFRVVWEGRHGYILDGERKAYRITLQHDGQYVSRPNRGEEKIGDNIALARAVAPELSFREAVEALLIGAAVAPGSRSWEALPEQGLALPHNIDRDGGRRYLLSVRLIEPRVLDAAERAGAVRYGQGNVIFCGWDGDGRLRNAVLRSTGALTPKDKRIWNLVGSDKAWPVVFPGEPSQVWIVEGGVDGLAVQSLCLRAGRTVPLVIVTGGIKVRKFLASPAVVAAVRAAKIVWLAREREKSVEAQAEADRDHAAQRASLEATMAGSGAELRIWEPPEGVKDVAELNEAKGGLAHPRVLLGH